MLCGTGIVSVAAGYWQEVRDVRKKKKKERMEYLQAFVPTFH